ncbi:MAG TPA: CHAD domain-containing protein [Gemmatimonadaceae bacterium]|nr:CHAD domain-containing protein [Gemmatimonadaceae bacterium]
MATVDGALLDESVARGVRVVALGLMADLEAERERLVSPDRHAESLHDFRVALRRLRSWLRAWRPELAGSVPRSARRRLRRIGRESNVARDAEVLVGWLDASEEVLSPPGRRAARWLRERFARQRREAESSFEAVMARDYSRARERLTERLHMYRAVVHIERGLREPTLAAVAATRIHEHVDALREGLSAIRGADDEEVVHRARIAGKRLRYLLEPLAAQLPGGPVLVERLKGLQDALGDMHDAHVWLAMMADVARERSGRGRSGRGRPGHGRAVRGALSGRRGHAASPSAVPSRAGLASLASLAGERVEVAYRRLRRDWGPRRRAGFFHDLEGAAAALEARGGGAGAGIEIERKYLLAGLPERMPAATVTTLTQGYVPGERLVERLRTVERDGARRYYRTVKVGTGLVRTELEEETTRAVFEAMWPLTAGHRLTKRRHAVSDGEGGAGALVWEIDEFTDRPLVLAEVELPDEGTEVQLPAWLAPVVEREVTSDPAYLNFNLAR